MKNALVSWKKVGNDNNIPPGEVPVTATKGKKPDQRNSPDGLILTPMAGQACPQNRRSEEVRLAESIAPPIQPALDPLPRVSPSA